MLGQHLLVFILVLGLSEAKAFDGNGTEALNQGNQFLGLNGTSEVFISNGTETFAFNGTDVLSQGGQFIGLNGTSEVFISNGTDVLSQGDQFLGLNGTSKAFGLNGTETFVSNGTETFVSNGTETFVSNGTETFVSNGTDVLSQGGQFLGLNGTSEAFGLNGTEAFVSNGTSEAFSLNGTETFVSNGTKALNQGNQFLGLNGTEEAFVSNETVNLRHKRSYGVVLDSKKQIQLPVRLAGDLFSEPNSRLGYTVPIQIGSPPQSFNVNLDFTSGDTWVALQSCVAFRDECDIRCYRDCTERHCEKCCRANGHPCAVKDKFDNTTSSTFKSLNLEGWSQWYDSFIGQETVTLGLGSNSLTVPNSFTLFATFMTNFATNTKTSDGALGLAFRDQASDGKLPIWQNAINQNLLDQPLFTVSLKKGYQNVGDVAGQLTFGALDNQNCESNPTQYFTLIDESYWRFRVKNSLHNGQVYGRLDDYFVDINIQSAYIQIPADEYGYLLKTLGATYNFENSLYELSCNVNFKWGFQTRNKKLEVDVKDLLIKDKNGKCYFPFTSKSRNYSDYTLGAPFLKAFCGVFDKGNAKIGFAKTK